MRASRNLVKCGVSMHPSHAQLAPLGGYDESEMLKAVTVPQLIMPTSNDPDTYRPGGLTEKILGDKCKILEFKNQQHGFTTRGEGELYFGDVFDLLATDNFEADLNTAMEAALEFFGQHV